MALEFNLLQKMNQQLAMTPQLQQAIKFLQFSKADLKDAIEKELQENPVLEDIKELTEKQPNQEVKLEFNNLEEHKPQNNISSEKNDWELYQERFGEVSKIIHKQIEYSIKKLNNVSYYQALFQVVGVLSVLIEFLNNKKSHSIEDIVDIIYDHILILLKDKID